MKKILVFLWVLISIIPVFSADNAGAFLDTGLGARSASLGLSGVALNQKSEAVYWNPAALNKSSKPEWQISAFNSFETQFISISGAVNFMNLPVGIGYVYAGTDGIQESVSTASYIDRWVLSGNNFGGYQHGLLVSTAMAILPDLSFGITGKAIYQSIYHNHASGAGADIAFLYEPLTNTTVGMTIQNAIKPGLQWDTESQHLDVMPTRYKLGVAQKYMDGKVVEILETALHQNRPADWHWGLELNMLEPISLRFGYHTDNAKIERKEATLWNGLSIGCGINLNPISIDVAWLNQDLDEIGDVYRVSLRYGL